MKDGRFLARLFETTALVTVFEKHDRFLFGERKRIAQMY